MTEAEWLTCTHLQKLFRLIESKVSERKCVLFAVACHYLPPVYEPSFSESLKKEAMKLTAAADFADRVIDVALLRQLWLQLGEDRSLPERGREWAKDRAYHTDWNMQDPLERDIASLVREVFGNPFRPVVANPSWLTSNVVALAETIYQDRSFSIMPILADALMDAGCNNEDILKHCRQPCEHVRGCWVLDLLTGRK
jgi:hypothetical protein